MKFVSVRELRLKPGAVWKAAKVEKDLVITANGRPIAILTGVNEDTFEQELATIQRARALTALDRLHKESVKKGKHRMYEKEIQVEIDEVRRGNQL
jgi:antitoxin (DNA-binding transcriptional repressor) of toxin-antitoxin stability system